MRRQAAVAAATAALALAGALTACGGGDGGEPASTGDGGGAADADAAGATGAPAADQAAGNDVDFCTNLEVVVTQSAGLMSALMASDGAAVQAALDGPLADATVAAELTAPDDLADDVGTVTTWTRELLGALEAAGGGQGDFEAALANVPATDEAVDESGDRINEYARAECGFDPEAAMDESVAIPESPEPPDPCAFADAAVVASAATAAGADVDTSGGNEAASVDVGVFAIRGCAYDRGALIVSTVTFPGAVDEVVDTYVGSTEQDGGTAVTEFDRGSLPDSTLITALNGTTTITVFEATTPFSLGFRDVSDPAALVAAAEAVLAATG